MRLAGVETHSHKTLMYMKTMFRCDTTNPIMLIPAEAPMLNKRLGHAVIGSRG